jgi:hypothetical protein
VCSADDVCLWPRVVWWCGDVQEGSAGRQAGRQGRAGREGRRGARGNTYLDWRQRRDEAEADVSVEGRRERQAGQA